MIKTRANSGVPAILLFLFIFLLPFLILIFLLLLLFFPPITVDKALAAIKSTRGRTWLRDACSLLLWAQD